METKKVLGVIFSLIFVGLFIFVLTWGVINFNKVKDGMSGTGIYTEQDINSAYEDGYNTALNDKDEYNELINSYRDTITTQTDQISQLKNEVNTLTNQNRDYTTQINNLTQNKENNEQTIAELELEIADNELTISTLENDIIDLNKTIETLNKELENDNAEIQILVDNIASLNKQIDSLNDTIDSLETANSNYAEQILSLSNQNTLLSNQIITLQNELTNNDSQIIELTSRIADLEKSISYYEDYIFELENDNHFVGIFEFDGSVYGICEADDNNKVSITNPESTEFVIFNYWMVNNEQVDLNTYVLTENTKFVANVTYRYTVKFLVNDTEYNKQVVENGGKILVPENPTKDKFDFLGWSKNGTDVVNVEECVIDSDTTFIAIFRNKYGLFNTHNGNLIYSWDELIEYNYLTVTEENELNAGNNAKRISGDLIIDEDIKSIGSSTFYGCSGLAECVLPEGITSIGSSVFSQCSTLESITIPSSIQTIAGSFLNTTRLKTVNYLGTLEDWMKIEFASSNSSNPMCNASEIYMNGTKLEGSVEIPSTITEIKPYTFYGFKNDFVIPNSIQSIGNYAFANSKITSIEIPSSVLNYGTYIFSGSSIENIILPKNFKIVPNYMFYNCSKLSTFDFTGITSLGDYSFKGSGLTEISLPNTITNFGKEVFENAKKIKSIYYDIINLPDVSSSYAYFENLGSTEEGLTLTFGPSVEYIPMYFFYFNESLSVINIPSSLNSASVKAFYMCINLSEVYFNSTNMTLNGITSYGEGIFTWTSASPDGSLFTLYIGETVTTLNDYLFCECYLLKEIVYVGTPSVTAIGTSTFRLCNNLKTIFIPKSVTSIDSTDGRYSPWNYIESGLVLYCEFTTIPSGFGSKWNYYNNSNTLTTKYGYTYEQYLAEIAGQV